jgi:cytochrome c-type biogenesis protein CcmH
VTRFLTLLVVLAGLALPALAVEPNERLADPALEARAREISQGLRCLVCRNETIDESDADLAHDLRVLLRQRLLAGDSDAQAVQFIVARYGQFVLLDPPVRPATYILWYGPFALLLIGAAGAVVFIIHRRTGAAPAPELTADERRQLERALKESEG